MSFLFNRKKEEKTKVERIEDSTEDEIINEESTEEPFYRYREDRAESVTTEQDEEYEVVEREILPAKIICPDCGGITLEGLDFCDKCGGELH